MKCAKATAGNGERCQPVASGQERCGYAPVRNPDAQDGLWKFQDGRQAAYAKAELSPRDQIAAVRRLMDDTK